MNVPWHWLVVDYFYFIVGRIGMLIDSLYLVDIAIAHMTQRIEQIEAMMESRDAQ